MKIGHSHLSTHRTPLYVLGIMIAVLCLGTFKYLADGAAAPILETKTFAPSSDRNFSDYKLALEQLVRAKRSATRDNDFCVLGELASDNTKSAWILWRQGREIILWEGNGADLALSRRIINLQSDVVPTESDLHGSTYLVTKSWVDDMTSRCERLGTKVHIPKS